MVADFFKIGDSYVGSDAPCYVIAEMSANHAGKLDHALDIIRKAKECGADAVKLQTYRADTITLDVDSEDFQIPSNNPWESHKSLFSLYQKAHTPWEWHEALFNEAKKVGITLFSSPFDPSAVQLLESLGAPAYKIASPEITDIPLIAQVAQTGKPVIISTGLAELADIELAVETLRSNGCEDFALLRCTSAYPAPIEEANLALLADMSERFNCVVGLSDHTIGNAVPIASLHLGGRIIEKHFMLEGESDSLDSFFSLDPEGLTSLIADIRLHERIAGNKAYAITESAQKNVAFRRSLYVSQDIKAGEFFSYKNIKSVRPGFGLHPKYLDQIVGKKALKDLNLGDRLTEDTIEGFEIS